MNIGKMDRTTIYVAKLYPGRYVVGIDADNIRTARTAVNAKWFSTAELAHEAFPGVQIVRVTIEEIDAW